MDREEIRGWRAYADMIGYAATYLLFLAGLVLLLVVYGPEY